MVNSNATEEEDILMPSVFLEHANITVRDPKRQAEKLCDLFDWKIRWDGADKDGNIIANGVYLCRIKYQEKTTIQPITLLR